MKQLFLSMVMLLAAIIVSAQAYTTRKPANYEAAKWKLWLLDNPEQVQIAPPPNAAETRAELQKIKAGLSKLDPKKLAAIQYWDAGAPSYRWNQFEIKMLDYKSEVLLRTPASWMNMAIYDATVLAWKEKLKYKRSRPQAIDPTIHPVVEGPSTYAYPCEHAVTAAAAATMLAYFFPEKADSILEIAHAAAQSRVDAGLQFPSDIEAGWQLGEQVAKQLIAKAKNDGSAKKWTGEINKDPKRWTGKFAMGSTLPLFTPMVLTSADQFRPGPPPDFEADMNELKQFKQNYRSRAQAYYWANAGPELWNDLVSQKMFESRISDDAPAAARIYTILNAAFHDMAIAVFDAKYAYWGIRPVQYDSTYKPLITTPPFPGYPSGHAAGAATSAAVLEYFFPADSMQFRQLAKDCADSRFYAGIHFRTDNEIATKMGTTLGRYIVETWMKQ